MMTDLFLDLGKPTMKSIEISVQIVGGIESGWSVPESFDCLTLIALTGITFIHKGVDVMFHTIPRKKECLTSFIGFGKTGMPSCR
jgi:hypothetical protein